VAESFLHIKVELAYEKTYNTNWEAKSAIWGYLRRFLQSATPLFLSRLSQSRKLRETECGSINCLLITGRPVVKLLLIYSSILKDKLFLLRHKLFLFLEMWRLKLRNKVNYRGLTFDYHIGKDLINDYGLTEIVNINNFIGNKYEREIRVKIFDYIDEQTICVDVGAHHGLYTMLMGRAGKKVYAFEANPYNYKKLCLNIEHNKFKNVYLENIIISDSRKHYNFLLSGNSFLSQIDEVNFLSDELHEFENLVLCKIDSASSLRLSTELHECVRSKRFLEFICKLYDLIIKERSKFDLIELRGILSVINRYTRYFERYICEMVTLESKVVDDCLADVSGEKFFMKIDVEGSELLAVKGAEKFIKSKLPIMFVESTEIEPIAEFLENINYRMHKVDFKSYFFTPA
jgi:hypothetical protein